MSLRTATYVLETVSVICPTCDSVIPDPAHGSEFWTMADLDGVQIVRCSACGSDCKVPKKVHR